MNLLKHSISTFWLQRPIKGFIQWVLFQTQVTRSRLFSLIGLVLENKELNE